MTQFSVRQKYLSITSWSFGEIYTFLNDFTRQACADKQNCKTFQNVIIMYRPIHTFAKVLSIEYREALYWLIKIGIGIEIGPF